MKKNEKKRLHFGIVFPSLDNTHKYGLLTGISEYAKKNDIHLTAYYGTYEADNYDFASHYEPCFDAINNSNSLDGVALFSGFIAHNIGPELFEEYVMSIPKHIPVVSIGMPIKGVYSVVVDNATGMYNAVNHLIQWHEKKNIAIIKGPDGHQEADARFAGYKRALEENGIALNENLILQGSFTPMSGRDTTTELLDVRKAEFDAIVACDDEAALGAMQVLKQRNINVPDDIAVTGFDDVEEAATHDPALSTVQQDFSRLGAIAGELLSNIASKKDVDKDIYVVPGFVMRRSCGCEEKVRAVAKYIEPREIVLRRRRITDNLVLKFNLESLADELKKSLPFISINSALVGIYHNPIDGENRQGDRTIDTVFGFDGEKRIYFKNSSGAKHLFSDYSLVKDFDFDRERRLLFFLPLFFGDEESGIALISCDGSNPVDSFETLRRNISTAVKGASLLDKISLLSVTDELTGLLNRRGFYQFVYSRLSYLQRERGLIPIVLVMDMDGLKSINDTYGHAEGDTAISTFANLLKEVTREGDIVGRVGGDEFVVFSVMKSESQIKNLENRIRARFDEFNAGQVYPYNVSGSIGSVIIRDLSNEGFDRALNSADEVLYEEKAEKRAKGLSRQ